MSDADLLAPTLLNVPVKIRSYNALQVARPRLELALANSLLATDLVALTDSDVREGIAPLYAILDDAGIWNVQGTTLSKVLHRKRPSSVVLHDRWVRKCYLGTDAVRHEDKRSCADYVVLGSLAIRNDLHAHGEQFDILAWRSKGEATREKPVADAIG